MQPTDRRPTGVRTSAHPFFALLLSLALGAAGGCGDRAPASEGPSAPPIRVATQTVARTTAKVERRYSGYAHPWEAHGVGFLVGGRVTQILVSDGDIVAKGQMLATLAPEDYALMKRLADVQVEAIKPNFERVDDLVADKALPQATLDELKGRYEAALTQRKQAQRQLEYTRLRAPCDGVVMERRTAVGQVIGAGMPAVVVLDLSRIKARFGVPQQDLGLFELGREVTLRFPGVEGERVGTVHHIAFVPDPKTRTYDVVVAVDNADGALRAGMLTHVTVTAREAEGIFVPLRAVRTNANREHIVFLYDAQTSRVVERRVEKGDLFGTDLEVSSGLEPGDVVIVEGQGFVSPGDEVQPR
jgi:RND family efflux transporter MFP subunit